MCGVSYLDCFHTICIEHVSGSCDSVLLIRITRTILFYTLCLLEKYPCLLPKLCLHVPIYAPTATIQPANIQLSHSSFNMLSFRRILETLCFLNYRATFGLPSRLHDFGLRFFCWYNFRLFQCPYRTFQTDIYSRQCFNVRLGGGLKSGLTLRDW
jgi:hypothetical protein